jgi:hypothetical protein
MTDVDRLTKMLHVTTILAAINLGLTIAVAVIVFAATDHRAGRRRPAARPLP